MLEVRRIGFNPTTPWVVMIEWSDGSQEFIYSDMRTTTEHENGIRESEEVYVRSRHIKPVSRDEVQVVWA